MNACKVNNNYFCGLTKNQMNKNTSNMIIATLLILLAAASRVIMYPHNFSPIIGMALFAGAVFTDKKYACFLPLTAMFLSDVVFEISGIAKGFYGPGQVVNYLLLAAITVIAFTMKKIQPVRVAAYSIFSSLLFYVFSNLSFFLIDNPVYHTYPQTGNGLVQCYIAALPFLKTGMIADLVYSGLLFGVFALISKPAVRTVHA